MPVVADFWSVLYASALLKVVGVFVLILVLARVKVPLGLAIISGSLVTGVVFGLGPLRIGEAAGWTLVKADTIGMLAVTVMLLGLSATMQAGGQMQLLVELARAFFRRPAAAMAALPALIGLLPMPGGAIFSAPMVETAAEGHDVSAGHKSAVNYWFRHIWEHWWPLYPGVILATTFVPGANFASFAAMQLPLGLVMTAAGLVILFRLHPDTHRSGPPASPGLKRKLLLATRPIWLIIVVWLPVSLTMSTLLPWLAESLVNSGRLDSWWHEAVTTELYKSLSRFIPIGVGLLASIVVTTRAIGLDAKTVRGIWTRKSTYSLVGLVVSVMLFQAMLKEVNAAKGIGDDLGALHVPLVAVVMILPAIAGAITGLAFGFVGTSFPIVLPLIATAMPEQALWPYAVLAYGFGHVGMMASPLHMCHVVSNRYFNTPFGPVYRHILPPAFIMLAGTVLYFMLLQLLAN